MSRGAVGPSPPDIVSRAAGRRVRQTLADPSLTPAAVLLLIYPKEGDYCVLLNKRSELVEHHKSEISLPGGAQEPEDIDLLDTALRETEEEMGIRRADVTILGELDEVATRSRFRVRVFIATIPYPYRFQPSAFEIDEVLEVPLTSLRDPSNLRVETRWEHGGPVTSYAYAHNGHLVFGATARILQQFLGLLEGELEKEKL